MMLTKPYWGKLRFAWKSTIIFGAMMAGVCFLSGCGVTSAATTSQSGAMVLSPTATVTLSCADFNVTSTTPPPLPYRLPPGTIFGGANAIHGEGMIDLCTPMAATDIDQFMRTTLAQAGWHLFAPGHDTNANCLPDTLGWIKGHDAVNWTFTNYDRTPLGPPRWHLLTCGEVNMPPL